MSVTGRNYKLAEKETWQSIQAVVQITQFSDGSEDRIEILAIPSSTSPELKFDIVQTLNRVYQTGRDDKSPGPVGE